jgi:hypothetical protein
LNKTRHRIESGKITHIQVFHQPKLHGRSGRKCGSIGHVWSDLGIPYLYIRYDIFLRIENQYRLTKYGKVYAINAHNDKDKISLINA